jgi:hypothetical protein
MFSDGVDLITPAPAGRIAEILRDYAHPRPDGTRPEHGTLDFGRLDVRCTDDDALRRGEGLAIVELNGVTAESTNIYDPRRGLIWSYRVLFRQWRTLYELGARRRDRGARPMSVGELLTLLFRYYRDRPGPAVAD